MVRNDVDILALMDVEMQCLRLSERPLELIRSIVFLQVRQITVIAFVDLLLYAEGKLVIVNPTKTARQRIQRII